MTRPLDEILCDARQHRKPPPVVDSDWASADPITVGYVAQWAGERQLLAELVAAVEVERAEQVELIDRLRRERVQAIEKAERAENAAWGYRGAG